ncbi:MAG TPA: cellulase family glycosylhydrolase [Patescibacteria group bacterium]|nr:cellulase family glycosylhydrolase [Patescibacteria group bacterium]
MFAFLIVGLGAGLFWRSHSNSAAPQKPPVTKNTLNNPTPVHAYGIAAGSSLTTLNDAQLDATLSGIEATGSSWVRLDFDWGLIQPDNKNSYDWTIYDKIVAASTKHHLQVLGILTYTPAWARSSACADSDKCHPADPAQYASFAAAAARRYKDSNVHCWEIWNEPNNPDFWQPAANPGEYTTLLKQAYAAVRAQDSYAYVITGGLSPQATTSTSYSPKAFLNGVYTAGGKGYFDAVGDHPYTFPLSPKSTDDHAWVQMASAQSSLRQIMIANGDTNKKIWITEFGAPTGGPGPVSTIAKPNLSAHPYVVDEALQAKILSDAVELYGSYSWVGPFFWYSYRDAGTAPTTNENFFGLLRFNQSQKPAYKIFQDAAQAAR